LTPIYLIHFITIVNILLVSLIEATLRWQITTNTTFQELPRSIYVHLMIFEMYIIATSSGPLILGIPFLRQNKVVLDFQDILFTY